MNTISLTQRALAKNDWPLVQMGRLTIVRSPLLSEQEKLLHAFTTRLGGDSLAPMESFNLGRHIEDEQARQDAVDNRRTLCKELGVPFEKLTVPGQQHTTNIYIVVPDQASHDQRLPQLDGAATDKPLLPLLLHFADCVPVIVYDRKQHVLSVVHAGWKGTAGSIAAKAVKLMQEQFNCSTTDIVAAVGPAIGSCCYPTGQDVARQLSECVSDASELVTYRQQPQPDLKAINAMQLLEAGVQDVDVCSWCTACNPDLFYSHRQSQGRTGRQGAIACIQG